MKQYFSLFTALYTALYIFYLYLEAVYSYSTCAFPSVQSVSSILCWSRYSMQGPVSSPCCFSSYTRMSSICLSLHGMSVCFTGQDSSLYKRQTCNLNFPLTTLPFLLMFFSFFPNDIIWHNLLFNTVCYKHSNTLVNDCLTSI